MKNKDRYDLRRLYYHKKYTNSAEIEIKYDNKTVATIKDNSLNAIWNWLEEDYEILDKQEKRYLRSIIQPWRDKVRGIRKLEYYTKHQYIRIRYEEVTGSWEEIDLPMFEKNTMYQGMEVCREYTLKELGLNEK